MDLPSVLERIKSFTGTLGYVIIDSNYNVVNTSLPEEEAASLAAVAIKIIGDSNDALTDTYGEKLEFLRLRTKSKDLLISIGEYYSFAITRNPGVFAS